MSFWDQFRSKRDGSAPEQGAAPAGAQGRADQPDVVAGERGVASIHRTRSLQARASNMLAVGLMSVLALGFLAWYYAQTFARQSRAEAELQSKSKQQAQGEMVLPPLGRVDPPVVERFLEQPPAPPPASAFSIESFGPNNVAERGSVPPAYAGGAAMNPAQHALERTLTGPVFVRASHDSSSAGASGNSEPAPVSSTSEVGFGAPPSSGSNASALAGMLQPTSTPAVPAKVLPTQRLLLPKGAFVDCTLETAIDSSLPGMTTCVTATDTFSADGSVVLLERGTKLVGETRGDVRQGSARVYVLWTEARAPDGVVVPLASPGTDELGRAGLPGQVDRHFMDRFGAAILVSLIDGAIQAMAQQSSDGTVIVNPSTSRDVMTEVLRNTINIPPTVTKQQGDRIAVLVARDLDFRSVYELRPAAVSR